MTHRIFTQNVMNKDQVNQVQLILNLKKSSLIQSIQDLLAIG